MDLLKMIYEKQAEFEDLVISKSSKWPNKPLKDFDDKEKTAFSKELCLYLYQEIAEYVNAVGNYKMHKTQKDVTNPENIKDELADIFIFAIDLALTQGISYEELMNVIVRKQNKNFERQRSNY